MSEQLISQVRTLAKTERYKQDSFFFCGSPSDMPNEALLKACETWLAGAESGKHDRAAADRLILELEKIAPARPTGIMLENANAEGAGNAFVIWNLLDHRAEL